ncbi:MAG: Flp pilus assembly complex ATPase component TadA [Lachnospiraceae bacterium]|nr:Flp pilus assembly complex ATPase component TadA [Lachnospiraceae bacterium]
MTDIWDIIEKAHESGASDVHFSAKAKIMLRIEGKLQVFGGERIESKNIEEFLLSITDEKEREHYEKDGELLFSYSSERAGRFRAFALRQERGISLVIRFIPSEIPDIGSLDFPVEVLNLDENRSGLILISGGFGSGKSTTAAALVQYIGDHYSKSIMTVENPVEYIFKSSNSIIDQKTVEGGTLGTFVRNASKMDTDIIYVGEIEDKEGLEASLSASQRGHLVIATLCIDGVIPLLKNLLGQGDVRDREAIKEKLSDSLIFIYSQRLIKDCDEKQRILHEMLFFDQAVKNLVKEEKYVEINSMMRSGKREGMMTYEDHLSRLRYLNKIS